MNVLRSVYFLIVVITFGFTATSYAVDTVFGEIIEASPDKKFIQVNDRMFEVGKVLKVIEKDKPQPARQDDLDEGEMVEIKVADKKREFWQAETVTLYLDEMRDELLQKMEYTPIHSRQQSSPGRKTVKKRNSQIRFEDGVYRN